jgi:hypothetical protein
VNQVLEDVLRDCVLTYIIDWEKEFALCRDLVQQQLSSQSEDGPFRGTIWQKVSDTIDVV